MDISSHNKSEPMNPEEEDPFDLFELDDDVSPLEARTRIENLVLSLLRDGRVTFESANPAVKLVVDDALRVGKHVRTLNASRPQLAKCVYILRACHELLRTGQTATVRELYYRNDKSSSVKSNAREFGSMEQCVFTVDLCCEMTRMTRRCLNLIVSSKGLVFGLDEELVFAANDRAEAVQPLPSFRTAEDLHPVLLRVKTRSPHRVPRILLIVEKETVLKRIAQSTLYDRLPFIAVTAKGFPDVETRKFIRIAVDVLGLVPFAIGDYNPHGLSIMLTYAFGSLGQAGDAFRYNLPGLKILGLTARDAQRYASACDRQGVRTQFSSFTEEDDRCIVSLKSNPCVRAYHGLTNQVEAMTADRRKLQLDVLETLGNGFLADEWLSNKIDAALNGNDV